MLRLVIFIAFGVAVSAVFILLQPWILSDASKSESVVLLYGFLTFGVLLGIILALTTKLDAEAESDAEAAAFLKQTVKDWLNVSGPPKVRRERAIRARKALILPVLALLVFSYILLGGPEHNDFFEDLTEHHEREGPAWLLSHVPPDAGELFISVNREIGYHWFRYRVSKAGARYVPSYVSEIALTDVADKPYEWPTRDLGWVEPPWSAEPHFGKKGEVAVYSAQCLHGLGKGLWVLVKGRRQVFGWCMTDAPE